MRLLSAVLVLCLVLPWGTVLAVEGEGLGHQPVEHLLLDIPFGIDAEECIALVRERAGVGLNMAVDFKNSELMFTSPSNELRICDYPVELCASFRDDGTLSCFTAEGHRYVLKKELEEGGKMLAAKHLQITLVMFEKAGQNYGEAVGGIVKIQRSGLEKSLSDAKEYSLPMIDGMPDINMLREIFEEDFEFLRVGFYFREGVAFSITLSQFKDSTDSLFNLFIAVGP